MDVRSAPLRVLDRAEIPACVALAADRGWSPELRKWGLLFDVGTVYGVDDPDRGLAGMVTLIRYGRSLAAVGMMVVAQRHDGRGLGRRLMEHVLAEADDALVTLYATEHGRPMYEKLGLAVVERSSCFVGTWTGVAGDHGTRLMADRDRPAVAALDREVFGADRSRALDRLPAFADEVRGRRVRRRRRGVRGALAERRHRHARSGRRGRRRPGGAAGVGARRRLRRPGTSRRRDAPARPACPPRGARPGRELEHVGHDRRRRTAPRRRGPPVRTDDRGDRLTRDRLTHDRQTAALGRTGKG